MTAFWPVGLLLGRAGTSTTRIWLTRCSGRGRRLCWRSVGEGRVHHPHGRDHAADGERGDRDRGRCGLGSWEHWEDPEQYRDLLSMFGYSMMSTAFLANIVAHGLQSHVLPLPLGSGNACFAANPRGSGRM